MFRSIFTQLLQSMVTIMVAVLVAVVVPRSADATCGDYLMSPGGHAQTQSQNQTDSVLTDDPSNHFLFRYSKDEQAPGIPRCHGPTCSQGSLPLPAEAPKISLPTDRWAHFTDDSLLLPRPSSSLRRSTWHGMIAQDWCESLFRPPR